MKGSTLIAASTLAALMVLCNGCENYHGSDYRDNTPTSGKLKVYYDEGLELHVKNQALTFESQYQHVQLELIRSNEDACFLALFHDSCEAVVTSRLLNEAEKTLFASKRYDPRYSAVAYSGIALIASTDLPVAALDLALLPEILANPESLEDSAGNNINVRVVFDRNNSSVMRYMIDSIMSGKSFGSHCSSMNSSRETIEYVASSKNAIGVIDFAWISDRDDMLFKKHQGMIKVLALRRPDGAVVLPGQSSFKTGDYPLRRTVYVMRKTGDFTLAKGFESFVAGPKGQLTFLKQGLLPHRQAERQVHISMEPMNVE